MISSQLLNTTFVTDAPGTEAVERAQALVQGATERSPERESFLVRATRRNPALAELEAVLSSPVSIV